MSKAPLTLATFQEANRQRMLEEDGPDRLELWSLSDLTNALAGEAGELCNMTKKTRRAGFRNVDEWRAKMKQEVGDILAYAVIFANALGISAEEAAREKFNEISDRLAFATYITPDGEITYDRAAAQVEPAAS